MEQTQEDILRNNVKELQRQLQESYKRIKELKEETIDKIYVGINAYDIQKFIVKRLKTIKSYINLRNQSIFPINRLLLH